MGREKTILHSTNGVGEGKGVAAVSAWQVTLFFLGRLWVWREGEVGAASPGLQEACGSGKAVYGGKGGEVLQNPAVIPHNHTQVCPLRLHAQASQAGSRN